MKLPLPDNDILFMERTTRVVNWKLVYTKQAQKDAKKLSAAGLRSKAERILDVLKKNPFQKNPPYEKLVGDLEGAYSSRTFSK